MGLIAAKCSQCGCKLEIDTERQKNFCPACGTEYIQEKITNNQVTNIQNQINVYASNNNENVKPDQDILNFLFYSMDFENLRQKSLKFIELDKNNKFAKLLYMSDFKVVKNVNGIKLVDFQEKPVLDYLIENIGNLDFKFIDFIASLFIKKVNIFDIDNIFKIIMDNVDKLEISDRKKFFNNIILEICSLNDNFIETYYSGASLFDRKNREVDDNENKELELIADKVNENNTNLVKLIIDYKEKNTQLKIDTTKLLEKFSINDTNTKVNKKKTLIVVGIIAAVYIILAIIAALLPKK